MNPAVFLDLATIDPGDLDRSRLESCADWRCFDRTPAGQVLERANAKKIVATNKVVLDARIINAMPDCEMIAVAATGVNVVDLVAARQRGIVVCNVRDYGTASVAQHVLALMLTLTRRLDDFRRQATDGTWSASNDFCLLEPCFDDLEGKVLGIVGLGTLGGAVASLGRAMGMDVLAAHIPGRPARENRMPLDQVLKRCDVLSLHCPLSELSRGLIDAKRLAMMKPSAVVINTARGGIVAEDDLAVALEQGIIAAAAVDVLTEEPPPANHPLLQSVPHLIVTPHMAWASRSARQRVLDQVAENVEAFLNGSPRRVVEETA